MSVKSKMQGLLKDLRKGIYEKDAVIALSLLSSVAGESVFLLGPPGVAKSLIARRLKYAYKDSRAFEYLMSQFSTPDEIFGPVSISKLKDEDKYERVTEHYLPGASVVFLDEIWKAGPSIQNALLTALNERVYRNGEQEIALPMKALIAASNELPAKGQGLEALWDRFLLRIPVENIEDMGHFQAMLSDGPGVDADPVRESRKITDQEYQKWQRKIDRVAIPEEVFNLIALIKTRYIPAHNQREESAGLYISDRRWKKIARLLRASAFLNGRNAVDLMDCFLIRHCLWHEKEERDAAARLVEEAARQYGCARGFDAQGFREEIALFRQEIIRVSQTIQDTRETALRIFGKSYCRIHDRYIKKADLEGLTGADKAVTLYEKRLLSTGYLGKSRPHIPGGSFSMTVDGAESDLETLFVPVGDASIKAGPGAFTVIIDHTEQAIETITVGDRRGITKKPPRKTLAAWEKRARALIDALDQWKAGISEQERAGGRDNLFVEPQAALVIRSRFEEAAREIENLELEVREIQYRYRHLRDEETILG